MVRKLWDNFDLMGRNVRDHALSSTFYKNLEVLIWGRYQGKGLEMGGEESLI